MGDFSFQAIINGFPYILIGAKLTILFAVFGLLIGFFIGIIAGFGRIAKNKIFYSLATSYIEVIRGTPILVQVIYIYYAIPQLLNIDISSEIAGIVAIAVNSGAYIAEIVRGSIQAVPKGQMEAGRSLGLTHFQTMRYIIWPQAFKRMIPPLGNQFIISLKDTSLFAVIGAAEMTRQAQIVVSQNFRAFEIYTELALMYLCLTLFLSYLLRRLERRLDVS